MPATRKSASAGKPATKPARNAARPAPAKPVAKTPAPAVAPPATVPVKAVKPVKAEKADKPKKPKLVRDSFTIPKPEYAVLDELKQRAARLGAPAKKSEVLRAGIKALAQMSDAAFKSAMAAVPAIKTGRPGKAEG